MNHKNNLLHLSAFTPLITIIIIVATVFAFYSPSINYGFINWDDTAYIIDDKNVARGLGSESIQHAFSTFDNPYFMPLTRLSYMLDVSLFGKDNAPGLRLTNILIHSFTCMMLFLLVFQASNRLWASFFVATLFAIHPQHIETVVWLAGRKELLAGLFGMLSLYCYQQYSLKNKRELYLLTIMFFCLSLLNKPMWLGFPFLLLLWDFFPLRKLETGTIKACLIEKLPLLAISIAYALLFSYLLNVYLVENSNAGFFPDEPWSKRWLFLFIGLGDYVKHTFYPVNLLPYYPFPDNVNVLKGVAWILIPAILLTFFWNLRYKYPGFLMAALWFGVSIAVPLRLCIIPAGEAMFVGDRLAYMAHIGLFTGLVLTFDNWICYQKNIIRYLSISLLLLVFAGYIYSGQHIIKQWQTPEKLWHYTLDHLEGKGRAYALAHIAAEYQAQERYTDALLAYRKAHDIHPQSYIYPLMVGSLLSMSLDHQKASNAWFDKILDESPAPVHILYNHGKAELLNGYPLRAEKFFSAAYQRNQRKPSKISDAQILLSLGRSQIQASRIEQAISSFSEMSLSANQKIEVCELVFNTINGGQLKITNDQQKMISNFCNP